MIKDSELRSSVKALVRAEVRFLVDPEQLVRPHHHRRRRRAFLGGLAE